MIYYTLSLSGTNVAGNVTAFAPLSMNVQRDLTQLGLLPASLAQDTGSSNTDDLTFNATITGTINDTSVVQLLATLGLISVLLATITHWCCLQRLLY